MRSAPGNSARSHDHEGRSAKQPTARRGYDAALRATSALLHHKDASTTENYLGLTREKKHRDDTLRGQPFLSALVEQGDNVVRLPRTRTGE